MTHDSFYIDHNILMVIVKQQVTGFEIQDFQIPKIAPDLILKFKTNFQHNLNQAPLT